MINGQVATLMYLDFALTIFNYKHDNSHFGYLYDTSSGREWTEIDAFKEESLLELIAEFVERMTYQTDHGIGILSIVFEDATGKSNSYPPGRD